MLFVIIAYYMWQGQLGRGERYISGWDWVSCLGGGVELHPCQYDISNG